MTSRRLAAMAVTALLCAAPAFAQEKLPPLRTGVDGTFAPHAMPKLGGGIEGFQVDLFTEVARRMKREITIDAVSFSTLIPGMQSGRYDFIAAPATGVLHPHDWSTRHVSGAFLTRSLGRS
jgi:polar amino acid transport system substrate-binding protein